MVEEGQNDEIFVGKDYTLRFTETDGVDLSTFTEVTYALATSVDALSAEFTKTTASGISFSGSSNEVAEVTIDGSDTTSLTAPKTYYQELVTEDADGNEQVAATGELTLRNSVIDN